MLLDVQTRRLSRFFRHGNDRAHPKCAISNPFSACPPGRPGLQLDRPDLTCAAFSCGTTFDNYSNNIWHTIKEGSRSDNKDSSSVVGKTLCGACFSNFIARWDAGQTEWHHKAPVASTLRAKLRASPPMGVRRSWPFRASINCSVNEVSTKCVYVSYMCVPATRLMSSDLLIFSASLCGLRARARPQRLAEIHHPPFSIWGTPSRAWPLCFAASSADLPFPSAP